VSATKNDVSKQYYQRSALLHPIKTQKLVVMLLYMVKVVMANFTLQ